jgi:hypothetical protein
MREINQPEGKYGGRKVWNSGDKLRGNENLSNNQKRLDTK